jgi:hypothetical protein
MIKGSIIHACAKYSTFDPSRGPGIAVHDLPPNNDKITQQKSKKKMHLVVYIAESNKADPKTVDKNYGMQPQSA